METHIDIQQPQWEDLVIRNQPAKAPAAVPSAPKPQAAKTDLPASYLTHELRAPVTAIRLGLEILQEQISGRLRDDEKNTLAVAVRNTARLETLVNDIMDYSKIMAGRLQIEKSACDPRSLINEAADNLRAMAVSHGVKLVVEDDEPLPRVGADAGRVMQILTNLISNGIKFTPARGRVTVTAELGRREHAGTILFKVKDTGRGIPAKDLTQIFDMFTRCDNAKGAEGTGLGLTLARLMVEMHGGRIWADSWQGVGATLCFTIPIAPVDMVRRVEAYPREVQYTGLLVGMAKRFNAFIALFV
jgi:signal transduction histidine kinase